MQLCTAASAWESNSAIHGTQTAGCERQPNHRRDKVMENDEILIHPESVAAKELAKMGMRSPKIKPRNPHKPLVLRNNRPKAQIQFQDFGDMDAKEKGTALHRLFEDQIEDKLRPENQFEYLAARNRYWIALALGVMGMLVVWSIVLAP
jgi:hypothetical protein